MTPQKRWIIGIIAVCCCLVGIVILICPLVFLHLNGFIPTDVTVHRFLNTGDVISNDGFHETVFRKAGSVSDAKPPIFLDLSPYSASVFHTREGSDDLYLTIVWMFDDRDLFFDQQAFFSDIFLDRYGRHWKTRIRLAYPNGPECSGRRISVINATGFENNITAGYFITIRYDDSTRPAYYIVYYGAVKSGNLSRQAPYLMELMKPVFDPANFNVPTYPIGQNGRESGTRQQKSTDLSDITICCFGDSGSIRMPNESLGYLKTTALISTIADESNADLKKYAYPQGPLLGVGYGSDEMVVIVHKDWDVNDSVIREMYAVVERHGEQHGIKNISCRFVAMGVMKLESSVLEEDTIAGQGPAGVTDPGSDRDVRPVGKGLSPKPV